MSLGPEKALPLPKEFGDAESYVNSLLEFGTNSQFLQTFCGGVHILDFFTRNPDLYSAILPQEWRDFFGEHDIEAILDLLMRDDLAIFKDENGKFQELGSWRKGRHPPLSLIEYIHSVRSHTLDSSFTPLPAYHPPDGGPTVSVNPKTNKAVSNHALYSGMGAKKKHEVVNFARYVAELTDRISANKRQKITHIADFGAGSNYLGRTLALSPYRKNIIAIESRAHVLTGARKMDSRSNLVEKEINFFNKKKFLQEGGWAALKERRRAAVLDGCEGCETKETSANVKKNGLETPKETIRAKLELPRAGHGSVQYVEHRIQDGDLSAVIEQIVEPSESTTAEDDGLTPNGSAYVDSDQELSTLSTSLSLVPSAEPAIMVISLHSCGNLIHHGLRTITLNPSVQAVAMIGCCYNLMTERLGPPTYKVPLLRKPHFRLQETSEAFDPHGFPMSRLFEQYQHLPIHPLDYASPHASSPFSGELETGIRLNITARMMAVQAPRNWTPQDSAAFFTRHFYRAILQRIFVDVGIVPTPPSQPELRGGGRSPAGTGSGPADGMKPVVIGALRKRCYASFTEYVRGAVEKMQGPGMDREVARAVEEKVGALTDDEIRGYEERYKERKKHLSVVWGLMAFSSQVVEAMIVVDRWLWLREQGCEAWVEAVFDYGLSPRNLVVVGVRP